MAYVDRRSPMSKNSAFQTIPLSNTEAERPLLGSSSLLRPQLLNFSGADPGIPSTINGQERALGTMRRETKQQQELARTRKMVEIEKQWTRYGRVGQWVVITNIGVLIIAAIVCGAYFGRRNAQVATSQASSVTPSASSNWPAAPSQSGAALPSGSLPGAWPGTSLSVDLNWTSNVGYLFFQDSNASITFLTFDFSKTALTVRNTYTFTNLQPANGTSLVGRIWRLSVATQPTLELIYVAANGTLANAIRNASIDYTWRPGLLWQRNFSTPIRSAAEIENGASRVAMDYQLSSIFGKADPGGGALWAGDTNNTLREYAFDVSSTSWWLTPLSFPGLSGRQGVALAVSGYNYTSWLFDIGSDGSLGYQMQLHESATDRHWPFGSSWSTASFTSLSADQKLGRKGTFSLAWPNLFYETAKGKMGVLGQLDGSAEGNARGVYSGALEASCQLWSGSDIAVVNAEDASMTLIVYQSNSSTLSWSVLKRDNWVSVADKGTFVFDQNTNKWIDS